MTATVRPLPIYTPRAFSRVALICQDVKDGLPGMPDELIGTAQDSAIDLWRSGLPLAQAVDRAIASARSQEQNPPDSPA